MEDRDLLTVKFKLLVISQWNIRCIPIAFLPQLIIFWVQVHLNAIVLAQLRCELTVVIVRVGQNDATHWAVSYLINDLLSIMRRVNDVNTTLATKNVDIIVHIPFAAVETEFSGGNKLFNLHESAFRWRLKRILNA